METLRLALPIGVVLAGLAAVAPCMLERSIAWRPTLPLGVGLVLGGLGALLVNLLVPRTPRALRHPDGSLTISHRRLSAEPGLSGLMLFFGVLPLGYSIILWLAYLFDTRKPARPWDAFMLDAVGAALLALGLAIWSWEKLELRLDDQGLQWDGNSWSLEQLRSWERVGNQLFPPGLAWEAPVLDLVEQELARRLPGPAEPTPPSDWSEA